ncbi:MAG: hydrogenase iron-sulfur subunit [Betaproteobacteria bacterium]|nr:hydrogenase iron-sulfur subunit [Betaproteobacteria bacterium]
MSLHDTLRGGAQSIFRRIEEAFDAPFGGTDNPMRHLGALGFYFLWIVTVSGLYLYTVLDTSIEGVHTSIGWLTEDQWYLGGILRSLHRYASDAFILMTMLHLIREWAYGRYHGFRLYSWVTGVPLLWLMFFSGIGGYWIVWDRLAQFSAIASTELLDWLPIFNDPSARNFLTPEAINDRFFTMLVFIHLGVPLMLILGLWAHVHRISRVDHFPARRLALGTLAALLLLALVQPAISDAPADLSVVATGLRLDWFILFLHPLTDATSPAFVWALLSGVTLLLFILPLLPHPKAEPVAVVNAANCNGCARCLADCPYAAVTMEAHPYKPGHKIAIVDADLCAGCGICAGSCPSSTPFRSQETLVTGIDMPQQPVNVLRRELEKKIAGLEGTTRIVVFGCDRGAAVHALAAPDTAVMSLMCTGMLPPAFVEYALRGGADGVLVTGCRTGGCEFRLGDQWTAERLTRRREPHLRANVPAQRLHFVAASVSDGEALATALEEFRTRIETQAADSDRPPPFRRRTLHHD